jgi:hypothetical protein
MRSSTLCRAQIARQAWLQKIPFILREINREHEGKSQCDVTCTTGVPASSIRTSSVRNDRAGAAADCGGAALSTTTRKRHQSEIYSCLRCKRNKLTPNADTGAIDVTPSVTSNQPFVNESDGVDRLGRCPP